MSKITINIDGKEIQTQEGEYILNAARANDIFIPAICYLSRCSPTLACRLCLVEVDGKQAYACNAKAKDGMSVTTDTPNIKIERRAIMEVYDVNHPLECGVCDQSGECELQNYTLLMDVDEQHYAIKDVDRSDKDWGDIHYNAGLCIVCERCVTVCKDMIGDSALKTIPRGSDAIDAQFKESMPKDAYAMWNKLNKSLIGISDGAEMLDCTSCGECAAVCPVGALVDTHFIYKSNAWELKQIPATCGHCSAGCHIYYDVKHTSIDDTSEKIYRVMNEWNYVSLCGAGRYGFDYQNRVASKDEVTFKGAIEAFKNSDTISFTSMITNEEALILQKLKEKFGYKLINEDARAFREFLDNYSSISGKRLYGYDLASTHNANFVITVGSAIKSDNPVVRYALNNSMSVNKGAGLYFHPLKDPIIEGMGKSIMSVYHKPLAEESVLYLLLDLFGDENLPSSIKEYLASFHSKKTITVEETIKEEVIETIKVMKKDEESGEEIEVEEQKKTLVPKTITKEVEVDVNALLEMVDASDDFMEKLEKNLAKKDTFVLVAGPDLYTHPNSKNIARLLALIEKYTKLELVMIPTSTNTLGVSLICDLDKEAGAKIIGYNTKGDFVLSALGYGDLDMPAFNQQEGTLCSINKRLNPTNQAISYKGYTLNDIANELGLKAELTVSYTKELPQSGGFREFEFDELNIHFNNDGSDQRGYELENFDMPTNGDESVEKIVQKSLDDGFVIYLANPVRQFSSFTHISTNLNEQSGVYMSEEYLQKSQFNEGDMVVVKNDKARIEAKIVCDNKIGGDIVLLPTFDSNLNSEALFSDYRFSVASIERV